MTAADGALARDVQAAINAIRAQITAGLSVSMTGAGATTDAASGTGNGSLIAHMRQVRDYLYGRLPSALGAGGGLKAELYGPAGAAALPDAAALADAGSNPTLSAIQTYPMIWNPSGATWSRVRAPAADGQSFGAYAGSVPMLHNGTSADRQRGNQDVTALASSARTATTSSSDQTNYNGRGLKVYVNVTSITSSPSITVAIQAKDPISGTYTALLTSAAITGTGHTVLTLYPGIAAVANVSASDVLPRTWRVTATHGNSNSITYSVGASVLL